MDNNNAHIYQLAAIGCTRNEICAKVNITISKLMTTYQQPFQKGRQAYIQKQLSEYNRQQGK